VHIDRGLGIEVHIDRGLEFPNNSSFVLWRYYIYKFKFAFFFPVNVEKAKRNQ
jgi:hypothetical protein